MKNIILIGFMGTGKSTIGKALANYLQTEFIDMDSYIEAQEKRSIPQIFAADGEQYFRDLERKTVLKLSQAQGMVIATGGGTVKNPANMAAFRQNGIIVLLKASVDVILQRTATRGERPVLDAHDKGDRRQAIEALLAERQKYYEIADIKIDTGEQEVAAIVRQLAHNVQKEV